jgi:CheY-like chemotaxis protein
MKNILVVDDDQQIRDVLSMALEQEGYRVATAHNGLEAVEYVTQIRPDLVISDVMMPVLDGGNLASIMDAKFGNRAAPVLGMTALARLERENDGKFTEVIHKPFDLAEMLQTVSRLIGRATEDAASR